MRMKLYSGLMALDLASVLLGFVAGALLRFGEVLVHGWVGVTASVIALFLLSAVSSGAYSLEVLRHPNRGTARAAGSLLLAFALLFLIIFFLKVDQRFSRIMTGSSFVVALISLTLARQLVGDLIKRAYQGSFTTEILLVDRGQTVTAQNMIVVNADAAGLRADTQDATMQIKLSELLQGADRVVVSCTRKAAKRWAESLKSTGIRGEVLVSDLDHLAPLGVSEVNGSTTLVVSSGPLNLRQRALKRAFDIALSLVLIFIFLPVLLVIAIAIKLDSRGPVLFKQPRVGRGNAMFNVYKFRTMRTCRGDLHGCVSTKRDDDRLTRLGGFLRRTSLDELPQFFNVLSGSMSIVGPRPHALGSLAGEELFWRVDSRYWQRHVLKPGITGLAQIRGLRGTTHTREQLTSRLRADLEYVAGWSLFRDIAIIIRTVRVLSHPDAY